MTDQDTDQDTGTPKETARPQVRVMAQFIRDMSFENIMAQKGISIDEKPDVQIKVALDARKRDAENVFESSIKLSASSKAKGEDTVFFLLELDYVGLFEIKDVPDEQMHPFLMIECPRLLFPFLRRIVSDVTRDGGFVPLNIDAIDFLSIYRSELEKRKGNGSAADA